jgi:23S rRNA (adenine2503-C2)-methyltransferase
MDAQTPLFGMTLGELESCVASHGLPGYTARQIADWLYHKEN